MAIPEGRPRDRIRTTTRERYYSTKSYHVGDSEVNDRSAPGTVVRSSNATVPAHDRKEIFGDGQISNGIKNHVPRLKAHRPDSGHHQTSALRREPDGGNGIPTPRSDHSSSASVRVSSYRARWSSPTYICTVSQPQVIRSTEPHGQPTHARDNRGWIGGSQKDIRHDRVPYAPTPSPNQIRGKETSNHDRHEAFFRGSQMPVPGQPRRRTMTGNAHPGSSVRGPHVPTPSQFRRQTVTDNARDPHSSPPRQPRGNPPTDHAHHHPIRPPPPPAYTRPARSPVEPSNRSPKNESRTSVRSGGSGRVGGRGTGDGSGRGGRRNRHGNGRREIEEDGGRSGRHGDGREKSEEDDEDGEAGCLGGPGYRVLKRVWRWCVGRV